jgi:hypothetical protein
MRASVSTRPPWVQLHLRPVPGPVSSNSRLLAPFGVAPCRTVPAPAGSSSWSRRSSRGRRTSRASLMSPKRSRMSVPARRSICSSAGEGGRRRRPDASFARARSAARCWSAPVHAGRVSGVPSTTSTRSAKSTPVRGWSGVWRVPSGGGVSHQPRGRSNPRLRATSSSAVNCLTLVPAIERSMAEKLGGRQPGSEVEGERLGSLVLRASAQQAGTDHVVGDDLVGATVG